MTLIEALVLAVMVPILLVFADTVRWLIWPTVDECEQMVEGYLLQMEQYPYTDPRRRALEHRKEIWEGKRRGLLEKTRARKNP